MPAAPTTNAVQAAPRTQKQRSEATQGALLSAARDCFGRQGYHDTNTEDLVAACSKAVLLSH